MKLITTLLCVIVIASCRTKPNTDSPACSCKPPLDSLAFYFPVNTFHDIPRADSFVLNWYSSALYSFKEPVLSQNFVGHNIYRFLWLRSFHRPVVFTLQQNDGQVWLNTKMLDMQPSFHDDRIGGIPKEMKQEYIDAGYIVDNKSPDVMFRIADRKANIIYNKNILLSDKEWDEFEQLLAKSNFWKLPADIDEGNTDGAMWVIEGHLKNKYHVVSYHSPGNHQFAKAGRFLISLSGLQEKVY
jgi:hypothetical protein